MTGGVPETGAEVTPYFHRRNNQHLSPGKMPKFPNHTKETQKAPPGSAGTNLSDMLGGLRRQHSSLPLIPSLVLEIFTLHRAGHLRNMTA